MLSLGATTSLTNGISMALTNQVSGNGGASTSAATNATVIRSPSPTDVLCGKDKTFGKHPGNRMYRELIAERSSDYAVATSKRTKMDISKSIIATMQHKHGSRFLRQSSGCGNNEGWVELSTQQARDKATHALRFWNGHKNAKAAVAAIASTGGGGGGRGEQVRSMPSTLLAARSTAPSHHQHHHGLLAPWTSSSNNGEGYSMTLPPPPLPASVSAASEQQHHEAHPQRPQSHPFASSNDLAPSQFQPPTLYHSLESPSYQPYEPYQLPRRHHESRSYVPYDDVQGNNEFGSYGSIPDGATAASMAVFDDEYYDDEQSSNDSSSFGTNSSSSESEQEASAAAQRQRAFAALRHRDGDDTTTGNSSPLHFRLGDQEQQQQQQQQRVDSMLDDEAPTTPLLLSNSLTEDNGDRNNSLMLLSTIRSLSIVDYLDDDDDDDIADTHDNDDDDDDDDDAADVAAVMARYHATVGPNASFDLPLDDHVDDTVDQDHHAHRGEQTRAAQHDKETFDTLRSVDFDILEEHYGGHDVVDGPSSLQLQENDWDDGNEHDR
jgi:hypothetical protein